MVVGAVAERTEVAIVGAGPGGYAAALRAADAGFDTVLIDKADLGGTCLNVGCIPSKDLIETAALFHGAQRRAGLHLAGSFDVAEAAAQRAEVIAGLRQGISSLLAAAGVRVVPGTAHFARHDRLSIAHDDAVWHLDFDYAIAATGSRPIQLSGFTPSERVIDSTGAVTLTSLPTSMAVIGAGYIGVELGTAYAKLGCAVTIIEAGDRVLPEMPAELAKPVARRLSDLGVTVETGVGAERSTDTGVVLNDGRELSAELVVVAVGRRPNADLCSIEAAGATLSESGHVQVDNRLRATEQVYAIGDLTAGPALAHRATSDAERAIDDICGKPAIEPLVVPAIIFGDPEIMMAGVSPDDAPGHGMTVHRFPHAASARAQTLRSTTGSTIVVADADGTVVGVHAVGPHASELAGEAVVAIEMAATVEDLGAIVHPHPTMTETIAEAALVAGGSPLHVRRT